MIRNPQPLLKKFLELHHAHFNAEKLNLLIETHPDYVSINNLTDTLDHLNIPNTTLEIDANQLHVIEKPVIILLGLDGHEQSLIISHIDPEFVHFIAEDLQNFTIPSKTFFDLKKIIIVIIEPEKTSKWFFGIHSAAKNIYPTIAILALIILSTIGKTAYQAAYNVLTSAGIFVTLLIFLKENNFNSIADRICTESPKSSCNEVLSSKGSRLIGELKVSDLSMFYFATLLTSSIILKSIDYETKFLFSSLSLPIILLSLVYQGVILKKWCPLCLSIVGILLLQLICILYSNEKLSWHNTPYQLWITLSAGLLAVAGWEKGKELLLAQKSGKTNQIKALRFTRNYELFIAYYHTLPRIKFSNFSSPLVLGNPAGKIHLILILNPLCQPCADTYLLIEKLLKKFPLDIYVQVCFYCNPGDPGDEKTLISSNLLLHCMNIDQTLIGPTLSGWYKNKILPKALPPTENNGEITEILQQFYSFRIKNNIYVSPAIVINGKLLPPFYDPDVLEWILPYIIDELEPRKSPDTSLLLQQNSH